MGGFYRYIKYNDTVTISIYYQWRKEKRCLEKR